MSQYYFSSDNYRLMPPIPDCVTDVLISNTMMGRLPRLPDGVVKVDMMCNTGFSDEYKTYLEMKYPNVKFMYGFDRVSL